VISTLTQTGSAYGDSSEDLILIERFLAGEADAFDRLYQRYYARVFHIAQGILLRHEEAADVTQEIFTLVYRNLPRFDQRSKFSTWLFRVAVNRAIQQARSIRHIRTETDLSDAEHAPAADHTEQWDDPTVQSVMAQLAPDDRAILTLFYWEDLTLVEIAESLGCRSNAAKTRLFRARERFKKLYEAAENA